MAPSGFHQDPCLDLFPGHNEEFNVKQGYLTHEKY